jgi:hypothetical protein
MNALQRIALVHVIVKDSDNHILLAMKPLVFIHHESERPGSIPGAGTVNQAVNLSGVGKL